MVVLSLLLQLPRQLQLQRHCQRLGQCPGQTRRLRRSATRRLIAALGIMLGSSVSPGLAQPLPAPLDFVSNLDLACHAADAGATLGPGALTLTHLNPVLRELGLNTDSFSSGRLRQLCVPVAKNDRLPPTEVRRFIEHVDLACYENTALTPPPGAVLDLLHLNPVLRELDMPKVRRMHFGTLSQLCVPVAKNNRLPPPDVLRLVQYLDLACYPIATHEAFVLPSLRLTHLNPLLREQNVPDVEVQLLRPDRLCVPVVKGNATPPPDVAQILQWLDLAQYITVTGPSAPPLPPLTLTHLNPLFTTLEPVPVAPGQLQHLAVPVAKSAQASPE